MMRLRTDIKAPLKKALTYLLHPPYGYRNMLERQGGNTNIVEKLGGGAVVAHNHNPGQTVCCCSVASRETVALCALKLPTSNIAVFGMKSIEHPSYPITDDAYRVNMPLIGLYLEEEGDVVHVETYVAEMDVGGKIGKLGPNKAMNGMVRQMIQISRAIPRMQDVMGEPPYMQLM